MTWVSRIGLPRSPTQRIPGAGWCSPIRAMGAARLPAVQGIDDTLLGRNSPKRSYRAIRSKECRSSSPAKPFIGGGARHIWPADESLGVCWIHRNCRLLIGQAMGIGRIRIEEQLQIQISRCCRASSFAIVMNVGGASVTLTDAANSSPLDFLDDRRPLAGQERRRFVRLLDPRHAVPGNSLK